MITKIAAAQTWPSRVSDYQTKNNQWTITLLSHISLYATVLVFLRSDNYNQEKIQRTKHVSITMKKISEYKVQKRCVGLRFTQVKFPKVVVMN